MFVIWGFGDAGCYGHCPSSEPSVVSLWVAALTLTVRPPEVPQLCPGVGAGGGDSNSASQTLTPERHTETEADSNSL